MRNCLADKKTQPTCVLQKMITKIINYIVDTYRIYPIRILHEKRIFRVNFRTASLFDSKIWWTKGKLDAGIWHWADSDDTWFVFDLATHEDPSNDRVHLQTDNWMNGKSNKSSMYNTICEMSKYNPMWTTRSSYNFIAKS